MKFPKTEEGFYVLTNRIELKDIFDKEYDNVVLINDTKLSDDDLKDIIEVQKGVLAIYYFDTEKEANEIDDLYEHYYYKAKKMITLWCLNNNGKKYEEIINEFNVECPNLRERAKFDAILVYKDYKDRCGNCHSVLEVNDKYCKNCGTKRGEGEFKPYTNPTYCVYGPMVANKYTCPKCGYSWSEYNPGGRDYPYCPQCGIEIKDTVELVSDRGPFILEDYDSIKELMKKLEEKAKEEHK